MDISVNIYSLNILYIMEPQLISRKAIKKILKKKYFIEDNYFNKSFNSIIDTIKINWLPILIIVVAFFLLITLYIEHQNKKKKFEKEKAELEKLQNKLREKFNDNDDFKSKSNYESEYYKMLPRVTNNPEVIDYMY